MTSQKYLKQRGDYWMGFSILLAVLIFGLTSNFFVIQQNGMRMPVLEGYDLNSETHFSFIDNSQVNYPWLTDRFSIWIITYSIGDLIILGSASALIVLIIISKKMLRKEE